MTAVSQPHVQVDMSPATIATRKQIADRRRRRIELILERIRRILDPNEMRAMDNFETWSAFALLFAVVPEEPWYAKDIHRQLAAVVVKNLGDGEGGYLPVTHARVLNLVDSLAWVADQNHEPDSWPTVRQLRED